MAMVTTTVVTLALPHLHPHQLERCSTIRISPASLTNSLFFKSFSAISLSSSLCLIRPRLQPKSLPSHGFSLCASLHSSSYPEPEATPTASTKLYVSGLSFRTTEEGLRNAFQNFGELVEVNLVMDRIANRPRGFAFLRYATEEQSKKAIEGMHGKFLDGRVIFVEVAKPRSEFRQDLKQKRSYQY